MAAEIIKFGTSVYRRQSGRGPTIETLNRIFESDPTNQQTQVAFHMRPAIKELADAVNDGPWRGIFTPAGGFNGDFFAVTGTELVRFNRTDSFTLTATALSGTIALSAFRVSTAFSTDTVFITDGATFQQTDGTAALAEIATPDDLPFGIVFNISNFIVCVRRDSQRFYWLLPGEIVFDGLNFAEAEAFTDYITHVEVIGDKFYIFGLRGTEVWYLTGDENAPFARVDGRTYSTGALKNTVCRIANSDAVVFVSPDGRVNLVNGESELSTPDITERIRRAVAAQTASEF